MFVVVLSSDKNKNRIRKEARFNQFHGGHLMGSSDGVEDFFNNWYSLPFQVV